MKFLFLKRLETLPPPAPHTQIKNSFCGLVLPGHSVYGIAFSRSQIPPSSPQIPLTEQDTRTQEVHNWGAMYWSLGMPLSRIFAFPNILQKLKNWFPLRSNKVIYQDPPSSSPEPPPVLSCMPWSFDKDEKPLSHTQTPKSLFLQSKTLKTFYTRSKLKPKRNFKRERMYCLIMKAYPQHAKV